MAYNEVQVGRFLRAFQKFFSMKGTEPHEITLAPEVMPSVSLRWGADVDLFQGWQRFGFSVASIAGVAAQNSVFRLRNPVGSNVIGVIESLHWSNTTGVDTAILSLGGGITVDLATTGTGIRLDARQGVSGSVLVPSWGNNIAITNSIDRATLLGNTPWQFIQFEDQEIPVLPGDTFQVLTTVLNQTVIPGIRWRERFLEESERT